MKVSLAEYTGGLDAIEALMLQRSRTWRVEENCPISPMAELLRRCKRDVYGVLYDKPHNCTDLEARVVRAIVKSAIKRVGKRKHEKDSRPNQNEVRDGTRI